MALVLLLNVCVGGGVIYLSGVRIPNLWLLRPEADPESGEASVGVSASSAPNTSNHCC